jgi:hypothetical protein
MKGNPWGRTSGTGRDLYPALKKRQALPFDDTAIRTGARHRGHRAVKAVPPAFR